MTDIIWKKKRKDSRFCYCFVDGVETGVRVQNMIRGNYTTWFYADFIQPNNRGLIGKPAVMDKIKRFGY